MKHNIIVIVTIISLVGGILDLVLNVAILSKVSGKDPVTAVETMYKAPVTPSPVTVTATPTASVSAAPTGKILLKSAVTPTPTRVLSPVPSHATLK